MLGATPVFATNSISIEFGEVNIDNQTIPILYNSTGEITGFQFFIQGIDITNVYGGSAEENNFYLHQGSTCWRDDACKDFVTGFSMTGSPIPSGDGILFYLEYAEIGDEYFDENISVSDFTCLDITEGFIFDPQGNNFDVELGECISSPIDCNGNYFGSAYFDECGICSDGESEHVANSDMDCIGECFGNAYEDDCGTCDDEPTNDCTELEFNLNPGANLISFYALPEDVSIDAIFSDLGDNAKYIIAEGAGAFYQSGNWYGSLQQIESDKGFWLIVEEAAQFSIDAAIPSSTDENTVLYDLHYGNNLISYPFSSGQSIDDAIDDIYINNIFAIAGSGEAAQYINGTWFGSLDYLEPTKGYWVISTEPFEFNFNTPDFDSPSQRSTNERSEPPSLFHFTQSPYQAFYWIENADIDGYPLEVGEDWIGAFYGDVCVGAREWSGMSTYGIPTDVPVMGYDDEIEATHDYIVAGEYPRFVIYDASEEIYFNANAYDNHIFEGALLGMYSVHEMKVERDCLGVLGGEAQEDNCGVCDLDPENDCPFDCNNVPGGDAFLDDCGICSGGDTEHEANSDKDDCGDCFGENEDMDCNGDCGLSYGAAYFDGCGVCSGGYSGHLANSDQDCNGDCFGEAYEDDCSVCSGGNSGHTENTDKDCNGDCFGESIIDDCGECSDGLSGHPADSDKDCNGDCFGEAVIDDCGICSEGESGNVANIDKDCSGDCFGEAIYDDCGECSEGLSGHPANSDQDCSGECFGSAVINTYYFDFDGDGLGSDTSEEFCNSNVPPAWVANDADIDDNCFSNYHDCMNVCDGSDITSTYYFDNDGDGLGSGESQSFCSGNVSEEWVSNSSDSDDDCFTNIHDCAGVCDGESFIQTYWNDDDGDGLGNGIQQDFCTANVPVGWVLNNDDIDDNCYSNYLDCAGVCNGFAQINTYYFDVDGDGLGNGSVDEFCSATVPDGWVLNNDDVDDNCYSNAHDCAGVCDGSSVIDECGECGGDDSLCADECGVPNGDNSTCMDECGVPNGDSSSCADCAGIPNGDAVVDNCGTCDSDSSNDCVQDCANEWGGSAIVETYYYDQDGDGLGAGESVEYCNSSVPDGWVLNNDDIEPDCTTNDIDDCGVCGGDNSSCADCTGVPNGDSVLDNCGVCDNNPENDCPFDCAGIPGGNAYYDDCGICSGGSTEHNPNSDMDQCGVCFGNNEDQQGCGCFNGAPTDYWYDYDSDGLGSCTVENSTCLPCENDSNCESFCGWDVPGNNWVSNADDEDDYCYSNVHDCAGECDGTAIVQDYWYDSDGDELGFGDDNQSYCSAEVPNGWVSNNSDDDDNCFSNFHDCMGICDGEDVVLTFYLDNDGDGLGNEISDEFCTGEVDTTVWVLNSDDEDDNCFSNIHDCANECDGDAVIQTYWNDDDGDGLGGGIDEEFCSSEVPSGWVLNSDDEDDNCYSNYHDCAGECNGFSQINTYYLDEDLDGLGIDIVQDFCSAVVPEGWVLNNDDEDDNCFSNIHDCANVCDGNAVIQTYWIDDDGDGLGNEIEEDFCSAEVPDGWVLNNDDFDDNCYSNVHDCAGICDGLDVDQTYWNDDDGDGLGNGIEEVFCSAEVPDGWVLNNDDLDDNCYSNDHDCMGVCDGESFIQTYWNDDDGDGLGDGIEEEFCSAEVPEGWVLNNDDEDDNCFSNIHDCAYVCDGEAVNQTYWNDDDGDGLGNGINQVFCSAQVPEGWVLNNDDLDDNCFSNIIDQCGICEGDDSTCSGCTDNEAFNYGCHNGEIPPCDDEITLDDGSCIYPPEKFTFNQSQQQAFYIIQDATIQYDENDELEDLEILTDWIGVFKDSVCVGTYPWTGYETTLPAMGYDGSTLTENYLVSGDYPTFYIYNSSEDEYMSAEVNITDIYGNDYTGWGNFEFFFVEEMVGRGPDCSGMELGTAFIDDCGICICGYYASDETPLGCLEDIPNIDLDCSGVCEPSTPVGIGQAEEGLEYGAIVDNCGVCSEGSTDHVADSDELGCGCFNPAPAPYWLDVDSDGFGFGDNSVDLCLDNVSNLYADNNLDPEPNCPNPNLETSMIDECGDCVGTDVLIPNQNMDLFGECCEVNEKDSCGICFGDDSYCNQPVVMDQNIETQEDTNLQLALIGNDPNDDPISFTIIDDPSEGILMGMGQYLTYIPNTNFNGTDSFTFTATDGNWTSELGLVAIVVHPVNDSPEANDILITVLEDNIATFDLLGDDVDGDSLSYTLSSLPIHGIASLSGNQVLYTPNPNFNGFDSLSYNVSDSEYTSLDGTISISITPVPDAPYLSSIPDTSIIEGESLSYGLNFGDADGDELFLFVQTDGNSNAEIVDGTLFVTPQNNYSGDIQVTITASDGEFDVNQSFTLTVIPINDPPVIISLTDQTILEDSELTIELNASDPDGDDVSFNASASENAEVIISGNILNIIPAENFNGELIITVSASDSEFSDSTQFALNILPVNDAPEFTSDPILEVFQGELYEYAIIANDVEGDSLSLSISSAPQWINFSDTVISGIPGNSDIGEHSINVTLSDGELVENQSFTLTVLDVNDPPTVNNLSITLAEDESVTITLEGIDLDGDELNFNIVTNPENGVVEINENEVQFSPNTNFNGIDSFTYSAFDGELNSNEGIINITVDPINDPPYLGAILDTVINEGDSFSISLNSGDIDGDELLFITQMDGNGSAEVVNEILTVIPAPLFNGDLFINIIVSDGQYEVSNSFIITVLPVNDPPILVGINDQEINEDSELIVELIASDIDGDELTFYVNPVSEALMSIENNLLSLTPVLNYFGDINVLVSVSDGEFADSTEFSVNVLPVNDAPELISNIENISVNEGAEDVLINLTEIFYDVENGSELAYSVSENVNGLSAEISESVLTLSFEDESFGSGVVEITASDNISRATVSTSFGVEIIPVNDPPVVDPLSIELDEDTSIEITFAASDPEGDDIEYTIVQSPENGTLSLLTGSTYEFIPNADYFGSDSFIFRVSDGENQVDETASILIYAVNDNPYFITENLPDALENNEYEANILIDDIDNEQSELSLFIVSGPNWLELNGFALGGTPDNNDAGSTDVTLELSDGIGSVSWTADLFVENANSAPVVENLSINVEEDSFVEFTIYANDPEAEELSYNLSNPTNGTLSGIAPNLIYTPDSNFYGGDVFTFTAFDGDIDSDTAWVNIQVIGINDNPLAGDLIFEVDQSHYIVDFSSTVFDPDGDELTIITVPPSEDDTLNTIFGGSIIPIAYLVYEYIPPSIESDADFMLYKATDGTAETGLYMVTFNLYGRSWSRNFPPTAFDDNINIAEDEAKEITMVGFDVFYSFPLDGTENLSITQAPQNGILEDITFSSTSSEQLAQWTAVYTPGLNYNGEDEIRYTVENPSNENGISEEGIISITINPVNDLPILNSISNITIDEDTENIVDIYFEDTDSDLALSATSSNNNIFVQFTESSNSIKIQPDNNFYGNAAITVTATEVNFDFEQSTAQAFYFITEAEIDGVSIQNGDQIIAYKQNSFGLPSGNPIGGAVWEGSNTDVVVMGNDGSEYTSDYLQVGDTPVFRIYSHSANQLFDVNANSELNPFENLGIQFVDKLEVIYDCLGTLGGHHYFDSFGNCISNIPEDYSVTGNNQGNSVTQIFTVDILPVNDSPILTTVNDISFGEDESTTISLSATDVDYVSFTYSAESNTEDIQVTVSNNLLSLTASNDFSGEGTISVSVVDNEGAEDSQEVSIEILPVNDAPLLDTISDLTLSEDTSTEITLVASDVDSQDLEFSAIGSEHISVAINENILTISPENDWSGSENITIMVSDGELSESGTVTITVLPVNDPPVLSSISNQDVDEDNSIDVFLNASDIEGDYLTYNVIESGGIGTSISGNVLTLLPPQNFYGESSISVSVNDGEFTVSTDFTLTVKAVNDAPIVWQPLEDIELLEDSGVATMVLNNVFIDVDGDELVYSISLSSEDIITAEIEDGKILVTTLLNQNGGPVSLTITADDQQGGNPASDTFIINVSPVNDPPTLSLIEDQEINEGSYLFYSVNASDVDGDILVFSAEATIEANINFTGNILSITPNSEYNGEIFVTVNVSDGEFSDNTDFTLTVKAVNDAPIVSQPLEDIELLEDSGVATMVLNNVFIDVDGDELVYDASLDIDGIINTEINGDTLIISTIPNLFGGPVSITVTANDQQDRAVASDQFTVTVTPENDAPIANDIAETLNEDGIKSIIPDAEDIDSPSLEYFITLEPSHGSIELLEAYFNYIPDPNFNGADSFAYHAFDGELTSNEAIVQITINSVNDQPILVNIQNQLVEEGQSLNYTLIANDIDGDELSFSASSDANVDIELVGDELTITPIDENFNGEVLISIEVNDGEYTDSDIFTLEFTPVNDPPNISAIENHEINEDGLFLYSIQAADLDGDLLEFTAEADSSLAEVSISSNLLSVTPNANFNGDIYLTVNVSDGEFIQSTDFTLTVKAVNDAPIVSQPLENIELLEDSGVATMVLSNVFSDVDGDNLVYEAAINIDGIIFIDLNGSNLYISTLSNQFGGPITITVSASDQQGANPVIDQFEVTVLPVNDPLTISSTPVSTAWEDIEYSYQVLVDDVDNDVFYYNLMSNPEGMVVDSNGVITWTPTEGIITSGVVALAVWDIENPTPGIDFPDVQEFVIEVISVNDSPEIVSTAPPTATEDELYSYQVMVFDPDDVEFGYTLRNNPEGMTINSDGLILWTPLNGVASSGTITVSVNDGGEDGALPYDQEFFIVVIPVNDPPEIVSTPQIIEIMVSNTYSYQILVEDIDDDEFSYFLIDAPPGMTIDQDGYLTWVPEFPGEYGPITILASDGGEDGIEPASQEIYILVTPYTDMISMNWEFSSKANLISYLGIPGDSTIQTVLAPLGDMAYSIIGEGNAAIQNEDGTWMGSLQKIEPTSGYWVTIDEEEPVDPPIPYSVDAFPTNPDQLYNLHIGPNLVSYVGADNAEIGEALPDDIEGYITGIISAGVAAMPNGNGEWMGSLQNWNVLNGYWITSYIDDLEFSFVSDGLVRKQYSETKVDQNDNLPDEFRYEQSTQQSFYFFDAIMVDGLDIYPGEWILATNNGAVVGAREWNGEVIDVPVMGTDENSNSSAYCALGDIPEFKLYRPSTGELIELTGEISPWSNNAISFAGLLENIVEIPDAFRLGNPFPNPFNPTTTITYDVAIDCELELSIYDVKGRLVYELISGVVKAGYHEIQWNANSQASGMYFLRMVTPETAITQKLILMK